MVWRTVILILLWLIFQQLLVILTNDFTPFNPVYIPDEFYRLRVPYTLWAWGNFDGNHYLHIAQFGYRFAEYPFFPLYPMIIRFVHLFTGTPLVVAGQIVSITAFCIGVVIVEKLLSLDGLQRLFPIVMTTILLFPTSFFYRAVYNDALFFALVVSVLYLARKKHWAAAAAIATFACATRLNGLALIFYIVVEYFTTVLHTPHCWMKKELIKAIRIRGKISEIVRTKIYMVVIIPLGVLVHLLYIHVAHGKWQLVFSSMKAWNQERLTFPLQVFWRYVRILLDISPFHGTFYIAALELGFVLFYLATLIYMYRKIRISYWIFTAVSLLIPSLTGTFQGMPRYGLHLYPLFLGAALFLAHAPILVRLMYLVFSGTLLVVYIVLFTRGFFIA